MFELMTTAFEIIKAAFNWCINNIPLVLMVIGLLGVGSIIRQGK